MIYRVLSSLFVLLMVPLCITAQPHPSEPDRTERFFREPSPELQTLVDAERGFARMSVEKGIRASFLAFFAEDGINFQPHPVRTREAILATPEPSEPQQVTLNWEPVLADISVTGDLGYTTGPYILTDQSPAHRPPAYGYYASVWRKQADGSWKVAIDAGVRTPDSGSGIKVARLEVGPMAPVKPPFPAVDASSASLMASDRAFLDEAARMGLAEAYFRRLSGRPRLHRNGYIPCTHKDSIRAFVEAHVDSMTWEPIGSSVAESGELGYTYGSYEQRGTDQKTEKGYYVRIWRTNSAREWKIMLDTTYPLPPGEDGKE